jgi:23S rRNA (cytosine1962-C5)-methyltransferase
VSRQPGLEREEYLAEVRERLRGAIALRREVAGETFAEGSGTNACRVVFSEGDGLPGIIIDRYGELVVVQLLIQGTAQADVWAAVVDVLSAEPWVRTIVQRADSRVRELERLESPPAEAVWTRENEPAGMQTVFRINGLEYHFDAGAGQKTGAFLDQRLNYAAAARWAETLGKTRRALDVCTYQGGFALHLARVCEQVTAVDASRAALEVADRNLELNAAAIRAKTEWVEADAFELMRDWQEAGQRFDTIVLDPPAFAKSKRAAEGAMRGYKELNLRAMKMLGRPGDDGGKTPARTELGRGTRIGGEVGSSGLLVTCSCSYHVGLGEFLEVLRAAAVDAGKRVQVLETLGAAPDHPAVVTLPETSYLKCLVCVVR